MKEKASCVTVRPFSAKPMLQERHISFDLIREFLINKTLSTEFLGQEISALDGYIYSTHLSLSVHHEEDTAEKSKRGLAKSPKCHWS